MRSLRTDALKKLATDEATTWINKQLQLVDQDPIKLIQTIETIPDDLYEPITRNILINKAIEVANTIPDELEKSKALRNISNTLLKLKDIDRAIKVVNMIPNERDKSLALREIFLAIDDIIVI